MVALQIRDVPDDVRQALASRAATRGQSLQSFLLTLLTDEARRSTSLAMLEHFGGRGDGSRLTSTQVTEALDHARRQREALLPDPANDVS